MKTKRTWAAILAFGMLCSSAVGCSDSAGTDSLLQKAVNRMNLLPRMQETARIPSHWFGIPMNLRKIIRQPEMKWES